MQSEFEESAAKWRRVKRSGRKIYKFEVELEEKR